MKYKIGQVFNGIYPPEAAGWCNNNNAHIEEMDDKTYVIVENPKPPEPTYADKRLAEYPAINDQLDMIYHDRVDGTDTWVQAVKQIKEKYPKPEIRD